MFENETQENILSRMIEKAGGAANVTEGSLVYSALALCAVALEDAFDKAEEAFQNAFEDTCDREHLIRFARKKGLTPYPATKARYLVSPGALLSDGDELTDGEDTYKVISPGVVATLEIQTTGEAGNGKSGKLSAVTFIEGFDDCEIISQVSSGKDEEETEDFRERFFEALNVKAQYGNRKGYKELAEGLDGVGRAFVSPQKNGDVIMINIYITGDDLKAPSGDFVREIQDKIAPAEHGKEGLASIGHDVYVIAASEDEINITASLETKETALVSDIKPLIEAIIDEYLREVNDKYGSETLVVRKTAIESRVTALPEVVDFEILTINGESRNCLVPADSIAKRGTLSV